MVLRVAAWRRRWVLAVLAGLAGLAASCGHAVTMATAAAGSCQDGVSPPAHAVSTAEAPSAGGSPVPSRIRSGRKQASVKNGIGVREVAFGQS